MQPKSILFLILIFVATTASAQALRPTVEINRAFGKPLVHEKVSNAKNLEEMLPYYPKNWIENYQSTTITIVSAGKSKIAEGKNNILTPAQSSLLSSASIGDQITIQIRYKALNSATNKLQNDVLDLKYTVVADEEAQPTNGADFLKKYFEIKAFNKMEIASGAPFLGASVSFVVDETGRIKEASLNKSSGNKKADQLLLETLQRMPSWKPATNRNGKSFSQQFTLTVVNAGC